MAKIWQRTDLVLATLLVTLIALMIIPLPQGLMDLLIGLNITLSVLLLMVSIYLKRPSDFSTFPTIILYGTAFRLAISIATTRLILTEANAGQIIETFGQFVISGSVIVGIVIFLIITVVQFIVITKGSERVAEVAARFCLDALPGKQMSIDILVRSGGLTEEQALEKRQKLDKDNQFYGAMDGSMKFVKGDAIAGLVITAVNIIGGISVGMVMHGMGLGQAMTTFTLLTIGDGLVAQIPALFMSMCAATVITRVTDEESTDLGTEIFRQLGAYRQALVISGVVVLGFALVPGFPWMVFSGLALLLFFVAYVLPAPAPEVLDPAMVGQSEYEKEMEEAAQKQGVENPRRGTERHVLAVGSELKKFLDADGSYAYRDHLYEIWEMKSGIQFPVFMVGVDQKLHPWEMRVDFDGVPTVQYRIPENCAYLPAGPDFTPVLPKGTVETDINWVGHKGVWIPNESLNGMEELRKLTVPIGHAIMQVAFRIAERFAGQLFSRIELGIFLKTIENKDPDLLNQLVEGIGLSSMHSIICRLVEDGIPLTPQRLVLETLYQWLSKTKDPNVLIDAVRMSMHRQICFSLADENNIIAAVLLEKDVEREFSEALMSQSNLADRNIVLPPQISDLLLSKFYTLSQTPIDGDRRIVVVVSAEIRRAVRSFLVSNNVHHPVISFQEVSTEVDVHPIAMINLRDEENELGGDMDNLDNVVSISAA